MLLEVVYSARRCEESPDYNPIVYRRLRLR